MLGFLGIRVDDEVVEKVSGRDADLELRLLEVFDGGERNIRDRVELSVLESGQHGIGVGENLDSEAIDLRLLAVPVRIPRQDGVLILGVFGQHKGTAAY